MVLEKKMNNEMVGLYFKKLNNGFQSILQKPPLSDFEFTLQKDFTNINTVRQLDRFLSMD